MSIRNDLFYKTEAEILRDRGIKKAVDHADRDKKDWSMHANVLFKHFLDFIERPFLAEEARKFARDFGLRNPPSHRAWGGIIRTAANKGLIRSKGYRATTNPNAHRTPAGLWEKI